MRGCIRYAVREGLPDDDAIEKLVAQICYRASDLAVLLELEGEFLSQYSDELRHPTAKDQDSSTGNGDVDDDDEDDVDDDEDDIQEDDGYPGSYYDPDDDN